METPRQIITFLENRQISCPCTLSIDFSFVFSSQIELKFDKMVDSVEETEILQNENTNKGPKSGKAKTSSTLGNPVAQAGGSSGFGGHFSTIFGG